MGIRMRNNDTLENDGLPVSLKNKDKKVGRSLMSRKKSLFLVRRTNNLRPRPPSY